MTPLAERTEPWMPNGFPPPSFVVDTERTRTFAGARGRWLAAAAILGVVLLIAGLLLITNQKDDKTALKAGSTSTAVGDTTATFPDSTAFDPTASQPTATLPPGAGGVDPTATLPPAPAGGATGTTAPAAAPGSTAAPGAGAAAAVLVTSVGTVTIPKVDSTVGPQTAKLGLQNTGGTPLNYTSQSQFPASLTVDKATGTIAPGATVEVTITLDGTKVGEGGFTGQVGFDGNGGSKRVTVNSTVGRPPVILDNAGMSCATEGGSCSKQIKPSVTTDNPCTGPWRYSVNVSDESSLKSVVAHASPDVPLKKGGATSGGAGTWQSDEFPALPKAGGLTFTVEAIDQLDYAHKSTERRIACP